MSLAWSSPGLARYKRPALALLTTNLVLSLWESASRPEITTSWRRQLVVNHCLQQYFEDLGDDTPAELLQRRCRIRSFAWVSEETWSWNQHFLAVANDCNEIVVIRVQLHVDPLSSNSDVDSTSRVLTHFDTLKNVGKETPIDPLTFDEFVMQSTFRAQLAWSVRSQNQDGILKTVLAYSTEDAVCFHGVDIELDTNAATIGNATPLPFQVRREAPFKFARGLPRDGSVNLVTFSIENMANISFSGDTEPHVAVVSQHHLHRNWDLPSAMVFVPEPEPQVWFAFHISTLRATSTAATLPSLETNPATNADSSWKRQMIESQSYFNAEYGLAGNVSTKVWGLEISPLNDVIATCITNHPNNQIEALIPADQFCTISFCRPSGELDLDRNIHFPTVRYIDSQGKIVGISFECKHLLRTTVSTDAMLFSIKQRIDGWPNFHESLDHRYSLLEALVRASSPSSTAMQHSLTSSSSVRSSAGERSFHEAVNAFRMQVIYDTETLRCRYSLLLGVILRDKAPQLENECIIIKSLFERLEDIKSLYRYDDAISQRITESYGRVQSQLLDRAHQSTLSLRDAGNVAETCEICDAQIEMNSLHSAQCARGHQFGKHS